MTEPETAALVALLRVGRRPWHVYAELIESNESARRVLDREIGEAADGQVSLFSADPDELIARATTDVANWQTAGLRLLTVLDADYPPNLRAVHDRPPLIFVAGTMHRGDARSLAVVGTRDPSAQGVERAEAIAAHLADDGFTVASGLASGIDTAVHSATLSEHARTVAVVGTGLAHSYPPENADLQRTIAAKGAVVSQFWPDTGPRRQNFPMRNAVMSGLTLGTVVVEASRTSGARIQARLALAHGRPVFLAQPLIHQEWARELSARPGTFVFDEPGEITSVIERLAPTGELVA